jgi:hypothetical protein
MSIRRRSALIPHTHVNVGIEDELAARLFRTLTDHLDRGSARHPSWDKKKPKPQLLVFVTGSGLKGMVKAFDTAFGVALHRCV